MTAPAAPRGLWPGVMVPGLEIRQHWIDADGVSTRCLEAGPPDAPPLVFLHGVGGHLERDRACGAGARGRGC
jgi:hypothetical protein